MSINLKNEYPEMPESFHSVVLDAVENIGERKHSRKSPVKIAVLVAAVVMLLSVSGFAADTVYDYFVKKENYKVTLDLNEETSVKTESPEYVKLNFGYMPDYLDTSDAPYNFGVKTESGDVAPSGITFRLFKNETAKDLEIFYVGSMTECMFGENQGAVMRIDTGIESDGDSYDKEFLINFAEFGYILHGYVSERIDEDEMIKIAENISLVESDKENAFIVDTYIPTTDNGGIIEPSSDLVYSYTADAVERQIGESFDIIAYNGYVDGNKYTLSVKNIDIRDNVNGLDYRSFNLAKDISDYVDENGNFKTYERKIYNYGDGVNSVSSIKATETVGRKIILIDIEVTNNENTSNEFYIDASICSIKGTHESNRFNDFEASYISGQDGGTGGYYHIPFEAGESKTVTYGFVIDDDADFSDLMFIIGSMWDVTDGVVIAE
ncbi:MAG: hypothetical protein IKW03_09745 [Clostridia bacterium]|nr:hypothetical protein [Clostridia bacterium]